MLTILKRYSPVVRLSDGKLYVQAVEREAKKREDSQRVFVDLPAVAADPKTKTAAKPARRELKWFVPLAATETGSLFDNKGEGDSEEKTDQAK